MNGLECTDNSIRSIALGKKNDAVKLMGGVFEKIIIAYVKWS